MQCNVLLQDIKCHMYMTSTVAGLEARSFILVDSQAYLEPSRAKTLHHRCLTEF